MALIEFSLVLPVLLIAFMATVELVRGMLVLQKVEKTIILTNNVVTEYYAPGSPNGTPTISTAQLNSLMAQVPSMLTPYNSPANQKIILTDVVNAGAGPVIKWQYCGTGSGTLARTSQIGIAPGQPATLPGTFTMNSGEEVVIGEIYYQYTPLIKRFLTQFTYYRTTVFVPRFESLSTFVSTCP